MAALGGRPGAPAAACGSGTPPKACFSDGNLTAWGGGKEAVAPSAWPSCGGGARELLRNSILTPRLEPLPRRQMQASRKHEVHCYAGHLSPGAGASHSIHRHTAEFEQHPKQLVAWRLLVSTTCCACMFGKPSDSILTNGMDGTAPCDIILYNVGMSMAIVPGGERHEPHADSNLHARAGARP